MRTSTGHGLAQMVKPDNLFLSLLWVVFFLVGVGGGIFMIHQSVEEFLQYGVITTTKIVREKELIMPALTFCSDFNSRDLILSCVFESDPDKCKMVDLTPSADGLDAEHKCVQINHGTNVTELAKATGDGKRYGYTIYAYNPNYNQNIIIAITENNAKILYEDLGLVIHSGQMTEIALGKTVQTALGEPYSDCSEVEDYRQVNCRDDCFNKKMTEICGCAYPAECRLYFYWTEDCKEAFDKKSDLIRSPCFLTCPAECNQVTFPIKRVYVEWELEAENIDYYKTEISKKFNISGITDDQFSKKFSKIHIYFRKLETTMITQSPSMTLKNLIANVGGLLGNLFI